MKKVELLAPAGDLKRAKTAIRYGADAVYLGGQSFSLRSRASNFSMSDIEEICAFAKAHNARVHVTVNVIPHEEDFNGLQDYLKKLESYGVTAIIAASPAIMKLARKAAPKLEVHCSTQMSVTNSDAVRFLKDTLDIDRAVLARECSIEDVKAICQESPVDTEAFIHGGMCVNYSGRCTLSNRMTLRDANRGGCAQSCRWSYDVYEGKQKLESPLPFTMGSRDLFAADYIADLIDAGVASFKIEGRMKTEYYVACIVSAYRHLIDEILANGGPLNEERMKVHRHEILRGENRETCSGFYSGSAGLESLIYHENSNASVNHDFLGTIQNYDAESSQAVLETRNVFETGEKLEVLSPGQDNRTFVIGTIRDTKTNEILERVRRPMSLVEFEVPFALRKEDIIRRYRP
jgi:putative protease